MADSATPSSNSENPSPNPRPKMGQEFWALIALGISALVCVTLLAVALAFLLRGNSTPTLSNVGNVTMPAAAAAPAPSPSSPAGIQRPYEPAKPKAERDSAMDRTQPALPGLLASPTPQGGKRQIAFTRADPPSPPSPSPQPTADPKKVFFRMRADPNSLYAGQKPLPMPVRYSPDIHGKVNEVYASRETAKPDTDRFSYSPDVTFSESGVRGASLDIQLSAPRKTASVDGYRAPKGFQFFTAKFHVTNQGTQPAALKVDDFEVHDSEGVRYLANPELIVGAWPSPSLGAGAELQAEMSFLVPEQSPLKELAVQEAPGQTALVPLQAR